MAVVIQNARERILNARGRVVWTLVAFLAVASTLLSLLSTTHSVWGDDTCTNDSDCNAPNGACVNSSCNCFNGYSGVDCLTPPFSCTNDSDCNAPNGACVNSSCNCFSGYSGVDCTTAPPDTPTVAPSDTPTDTPTGTPTETPTETPTPQTQCVDFIIGAPTSGTIKYDVANGPLTGISIQVDSLIGLGTSMNDNVTLTCCNCALNFTSGNFSGVFSTGGSNFWLFSPTGGTISLTGGVDLTGNNSCADSGDIPVGSTLFSGTFSDTVSVQASGGTFKVLGAPFIDTKNPSLEAFFGLPTDVTFVGAVDLSFSASGQPPATFTSTGLGSGDAMNCTP